MRTKSFKILSVGGSIIIPKTGFDILFLKRFCVLIRRHIREGSKFILVIGGGGTCRAYQDALSKVRTVTNMDLDWLGISTTRFNATFVRFLFKEEAASEIVLNPTKRIHTRAPLLIAAGFEPGHSTDMDAVLLAKTYTAKEIINLSNIDGAYTKDPHRYKDAKKISMIHWRDFRKNIVGTTWRAGAHVPFDPVASREAERLKLTVHILKGTNLSEVDRALRGQKHHGTVVSG